MVEQRRMATRVAVERVEMVWPTTLKRALEAVAAQEEMSLSALMRRMGKEYLARRAR